MGKGKLARYRKAKQAGEFVHSFEAAIPVENRDWMAIGINSANNPVLFCAGGFGFTTAGQTRRASGISSLSLLKYRERKQYDTDPHRHPDYRKGLIQDINGVIIKLCKAKIMRSLVFSAELLQPPKYQLTQFADGNVDTQHNQHNTH